MEAHVDEYKRYAINIIGQDDLVLFNIIRTFRPDIVRQREDENRYREELMDKETLNKIINIISTHEEGDGDYCDTGSDMEWSCRSECVSHAIERLTKAYYAGVFGHVTNKGITRPQQNAMHLYFERLAEALNDAGFDVRIFLQKAPRLNIPWTKELVKENLWKPIQKAMEGKASTTELEKIEVDGIYKVLDQKISELTGVHVEFPSEE